MHSGVRTSSLRLCVLAASSSLTAYLRPAVASGNNSCTDGAYWCTCNFKQCGPQVGTENVSKAHPSFCFPWSAKYDCWRAKTAAKFPGLWYSTDSLGWCGAPGADRPGCTWRVNKIVKMVNKTCSDDKVLSVIEADDRGTSCFSGCADSGVGAKGRNISSPCWIGCLFTTVLGPDAGKPSGAITGMPLETLRAAWDKPFLPVDAGGCPELPMPSGAGENENDRIRIQSEPLSNGARWHGFPGFDTLGGLGAEEQRQLRKKPEA